MPITQERMLSLIAAADDFARALRTSHNELVAAYERATAGADPLEELRTLTMILSPNLLLHQPTSSIVAIETERKHFATVQGRNRASANWQRRKRQRQSLERPSFQLEVSSMNLRDLPQQQPTQYIQPHTNVAIEEARRETALELQETYIPLSDKELQQDYTPDFIGGRSFDEMRDAQIASTHDTPHIATLHADSTISCSCGQVTHKSHTIWLEHYLMTHLAPITR